MKVIQSEVSETEYKIIENYVKTRKISIRKLIKEAVLEKIMGNEISSDDSLFDDPGEIIGFEDGSVNHDKYLSGERI
jgi:hypothetical protein